MKKTTDLRKLGLRSLGVKIGAQMLGLSLTPLIILAIILVVALTNSVQNLDGSITAARQEMAQDVIGANLQNEASVIQQAIDTYMQERMENVIEWANVPTVRQAAEDAAVKAQELGLTAMSEDQIERTMDASRALFPDGQAADYLNEFVGRMPEFIEVFFTDANGYSVAYSNKPSDFVQAGEEWWDTAWNTGISIGEVGYDESAGVYSVDISVRIENAEGKRIGVMKALLDIDALQDLATEAAGRVASSSVHLFTNDGNLIADTASHHDPTIIMTDEGNLLQRGWASAKEVLLMEELDSGFLLDQQSLDGQPIAVGYAFSAPGASYGIEGFGGFDWTVMITQSEDVAFASLQSLDTSAMQMQAMRNTILVILLVIGGVSAAVAVTIAVFAAISIANPIQMITEGAIRLSQGDAELAGMDWDKIAKINARTDELGSIGLAFSALIDYFKTGAAAMQRIAAGDVAVEIEPKSEADVMGNAFVQMIAYQQEMANTADILAEGDLTADITPQSENDRLGNAFRRMVVNLRELIGQVQENAAQVARASQQISAASEQSAQATQQVATTVQQIAQGTMQQTEGVTQTVATVDQMSRSIDGVARGAQEQAAAVARASETTAQISSAIQQVTANAQAGAQGSSHAAHTARTGAQVVQETVKSMESIREKVSVSATKVLEMGKRSEEIGEIVDTIEYIASQTNLFALNAAIEAARAGEHGKGFEVVAEEVRKLAESAAESTKEIAGLIKSMQNTIAEAVQAMEEGAAEVDTGVVRANESGQALTAILQAVETVNVQVGEIATASEQIGASANEMVSAMDAVSAVVEENTAATEEMAAGAGEVSTSIENIASISEENGASTEEVSASIEEVSAQAEEVTASAQALNEMAQELQSLLVRFRLAA